VEVAARETDGEPARSEPAMAIQLRCLETDRTAGRDWIDGQMVGEVEYRDVCAELGGEPTGDVVLCEVTREGSEATTPRQWKVRAD